MAVKINTQAGMIEISNDVIATVVGGAVTDVFGIVGMASKNQIKDNITEILEKRKLFTWRCCASIRKWDCSTDVYTIISYGTKF